MDSGTANTINGVCGTSASDVYAVGNDSIILHYNGTEWTAMNTEAGVNLNDIWCSDKNDIIAVGDDGTVIYGKGNKFPWTRVIQQIAINAVAAKEKKEKENK